MSLFGFSLLVHLQVILTLSPCSLSIRLFCYVLLVAIFYSKIVQLLLHLIVGMFLCHLLQFVGRVFFRCFGMSCFVCIIFPFLEIFLILLSFASTFWFISSTYILFFFFFALLFPFCLNIFQRFSFVLSFLPIFEDFLSAFPVEFIIIIIIIIVSCEFFKSALAYSLSLESE